MKFKMANFEFDKDQFVNEIDYDYIANHLEGEQQYAAACSVIKGLFRGSCKTLPR